MVLLYVVQRGVTLFPFLQIYSENKKIVIFDCIFLPNGESYTESECKIVFF